MFVNNFLQTIRIYLQHVKVCFVKVWFPSTRFPIKFGNMWCITIFRLHILFCLRGQATKASFSKLWGSYSHFKYAVTCVCTFCVQDNPSESHWKLWNSQTSSRKRRDDPVSSEQHAPKHCCGTARFPCWVFCFVKR